MDSFIPGNNIATTDISRGSRETVDVLLQDNEGGLIVDISGNFILLDGGIVADGTLTTTTLTPLDLIEVNYTPDSDPIHNGVLTPSNNAEATYTGAQEPTPVTWG